MVTVTYVRTSVSTTASGYSKFDTLYTVLKGANVLNETFQPRVQWLSYKQNSRATILQHF